MGAVSEQAAAKIAAKAEAAANEPVYYPVATERKAIDRPAPEAEVEAVSYPIPGALSIA